MRKTKIICTLGPAVDSDEMIESLMKNGMDCARFNFSHGNHQEQKVRMERVRKIRERLGLHVAILLDTKGPEIRLKDFIEGSAGLVAGQNFTLRANEDLGDESGVGLTFKELAKNVELGTRILIDDGKIALIVSEIVGEDVVCKVLNDGKVSNHKSINIPNVVINMEYLSEGDKKDIIFGIEQRVDYIAASFVRTADDVKALRNLLAENGGENIKIISKIENIQGVKELERIIEVSDGIMVARGDLGVEIPFMELPAIQKDMITKCYRSGKIVVTATQMLESMTKNPRPTRAEVSDVANAIYDGTTAIMLSGESAAGDYPAEAVRTMSEIALSAEKSIDYKKLFVENDLMLGHDFANAIAMSACKAAHYLNAKAILVVTRSGKTAELISHYRPACMIIAAVVDDTAVKQCNLSWGVYPVKASVQQQADELFAYAEEKAKKTGLVSSDDVVIVVTGSSLLEGTPSDMMKIQQIK